MHMKCSVRRASPKRFSDCLPVYTSYYQLQRSGVLVRCPKCNGDALLRNADGGCRLNCNHCYFSELRSSRKPLVAAQGCCIACERWFNMRLSPKKSDYPRVKVVCPHCKTIQIAQVYSVGTYSVDPLEGLSLYLQAHYRGHTVWALNRAHLNFLIGYIEAELREKFVYQDVHGCWHSLTSGQAQRLPGWIKTAKNRTGLLRVLYRMQTL